MLINLVDGVPQTTGAEWRLQLTKNHRPIFAPQHSNFNFFKGILQLPVDKTASVQQFTQRLSDFSKAKLEAGELDLAIPEGKHRSDLDDYVSIQHEFPLVYGIGTGGLPENAGEIRKVQALQLKGYLTFFDQLLADYLSQLAHLRDLFSWSVDGENERDASLQRSYYQNSVDSIPKVEKLIRFFQQESSNASQQEGEVLALSSIEFDNQVERDVAIQQLQHDFDAFADQLELLVKKEEQEEKYYFVFRNQRGSQIERLESKKRYGSAKEAELAGEMLIFLGTLNTSYEDRNLPQEKIYTFNFVYHPIDYLDYLRRITEQPSTYLQRRERFLNHLLARFGESFSEYVLLMFALNEGKKDLEEIVEDKARFLSQYADVSRSRGQGFNYTDENALWDTQNVSGLEKRVSGLMGLDDWRRRNLNNFQVYQRQEEYLFRILDHRGNTLLESVQFASEAEAEEALRNFIENVLLVGGKPAMVDCPEESIFSFKYLDENGKDFAIHPQTYHSPEERDEALDCLIEYFQEQFGIITTTSSSKEGFYFTLFAEDETTIIFQSQEAYTTEKDAQLAWHAFLAEARDLSKYEPVDDEFADRYSFKLGDWAVHPTYYNATWERDAARDEVHAYITSKSLNYEIQQLPTLYSWQLNDADGEWLLESTHRFKSEEQSIHAWYHVLGWVEEDRIKPESDSGLFRFILQDELQRTIAQSRDYQSETEFAHALAVCKAILQQQKLTNGPIAQDEFGFRFEMQDEFGGALLRSTAIYADRSKAQKRFNELFGQGDSLHWRIGQEEGFRSYWVELLDAEERLLAKSSTDFTSEADATLAQEKMVQLIERNDLFFGSEQVDEVYHFVINDDQTQEPLLISQLRYTKRESAYQAYLEALEAGKNPEHYLRMGAGSELSYQLINELQDVLAGPVGSFQDRDSREMAIEKAMAVCIESSPALVLAAYDGQFRVNIHFQDGQTGLLGEQLLADQEAGICHFYELLPFSCDRQYYQLEASTDGCFFSFALASNEEKLGRHPKTYAEGDALAEIDRLVSYIDGNKYNYVIEALEGKWHFAVNWEACNGNCETLLRGLEEFGNQEGATEALAVLLADLKARNEENYFVSSVNERGQFSFAVGKSDNVAVLLAEHPYYYTTEEERDKVLKDAASYLQHFFRINESEDAVADDDRSAGDDSNEGLLGGIIASTTRKCPSCITYDDEGNPTTSYYLSGYKLAKEDNYLAHHPITYTCENDRQKAIVLLQERGACQSYQWTSICWQGSLITYQEEKKFRFKIIDSTNHDFELFISHKAYASVEEAAAAFYEYWPRIIALAEVDQNYHTTEGTVYLQDRRGQVLARIPQEFATENQILQVIERRKIYAQHHSVIKKGDHFAFRLGLNSGRRYDWQNVESYDSPEGALRALEQLLELLRYPVNYKLTGNAQACIFNIQIVETLLVSKQTYVDCYDGDCIPKEVVECPEAWNGTKDFLIHAHEAYACYPYLRFHDDCRYSFRIVDDLYRLATHTRTYHTMAEREEALDWLFIQIQCQRKGATAVTQSDIEIMGEFHYLLLAGVTEFSVADNDEEEGEDGDGESPLGTELWRSYLAYETAGQAGSAYLNDFFKIIELAREIDFYQVIQEDGEYQRIVLTTETGQIIAVSPCKYRVESQLHEAILERIAHARQYPIFSTNGGYGFQCYSMDGLPFGEDPPVSDDCPPPPPNAFGLEIPGERVWESVKTYKTIEEAECAFAEFMKLVQRKPNYQRTEKSDCGPFGIELTRPQNVLAEHPASYDRRSDLEAAIERTKECYNVEGFHLIEHILLRPKVGVPERYKFLVEGPDGYLTALSSDTISDRELADRKKEELVNFSANALPLIREFAIDSNVNVRNEWIRRVRQTDFIKLDDRNITNLLSDIDLSRSPEEIREELSNQIIIQDSRQDVKGDCLAPACPDCCNIVELADANEGQACDLEWDPCAPTEASESSDLEDKTWYVPGADPYSFWVSILVPYWSKRFQNPNFRQFFQDTLRKEVPAHVGLRICWLDPKQMHDLERVYKEWLEAYSGQLECNLQSIQCELVEKLFSITNVYPPGQIQESVCADNDDKNTIFLDNAQLA
ncbi:MAG: hypothetical protein AAFR36_26940 [Bacteroidota bacterium]